MLEFSKAMARVGLGAACMHRRWGLGSAREILCLGGASRRAESWVRGGAEMKCRGAGCGRMPGVGRSGMRELGVEVSGRGARGYDRDHMAAVLVSLSS